MNKLFSKPALLLFVLFIVLGGYLFADWYHSSIPEDVQKRYVGRESCAQCHQPQCEQFAGSHHDRAMGIATDESVLGDFNDQSIEHFGQTTRMFRDGQRFMVNTEGPDGQLHDYEVKYVFGVSPLQQYMVELDRPASATSDQIGRVQVLRVSWDTVRKEWFYLSPPDVKERMDPDDPLHWTGITQNWNTSCAECHSTNLQKNYRVLTNDYLTTFSEIDVSCEACHGPASLHLELANQKSFFWDRHHGMGLAKLKTPDNIAQVESCAPCHSRRSEVQTGFQPGCRFDEYYALQTLDVPLYHADGQIRDEDYVYGSFLQSKMYHNGIRCSDCHNPHSAELIHTGNQVCTSCHQHPSGKYDTPAHHHHKVGTAGAACVNCHMPSTTYMDIDSRRDHSFRVPRPDLSMELNTPNACTACHLNVDNQKANLDEAAGDHDTKAQPNHAVAHDAYAAVPADPRSANSKDYQPNPYLDLIVAAGSGDAEATERLRAIDQKMLDATKKWYPPAVAQPKTAYYEDLARSQTSSALAQGMFDADMIAAAETDDTQAAADTSSAAETLANLARDARNPAIIRATALGLLPGLENAAPSNEKQLQEQQELAIKSLKDTDLKIVSTAIAWLQSRIAAELGSMGSGTATGEEIASRVKLLAAPLAGLTSEDYPLRMRTEAARTLVEIPPQLLQEILSADQRTDYQMAIKEYERQFLAADDRASSHMILGTLHERMGQPDRAIQDYRNALSVEPSLVGPRGNLAALLEQKAQGIQQGIRQSRTPATAGELKKQMSMFQDLAKLAAEFRMQEHQLLKRDVQRSESIAGAHWLNYRYGLSSYLIGDLETAKQQLTLAVDRAPENPTYLIGLTTLLIKLEDYNEAEALAGRLLKLDPDNAMYQSLLQQTRRQKPAPTAPAPTAPAPTAPVPTAPVPTAPAPTDPETNQPPTTP